MAGKPKWVEKQKPELYSLKDTALEAFESRQEDVVRGRLETAFHKCFWELYNFLFFSNETVSFILQMTQTEKDNPHVLLCIEQL
ncbi:hypothetical protein [Bartonella elizabethae]|nr:hypothetical protein [Bartonella elizabethae]